MIFTCRKCENDFLTEADLHIVIPTNNGSALECGCRYQQEITKLKNALKIANEAIGFYANTYNWASDADSNPDFYDCIENDFHDCNEDGYKFKSGGKKAVEAQKQIQEIMESK